MPPTSSSDDEIQIVQPRSGPIAGPSRVPSVAAPAAAIPKAGPSRATTVLEIGSDSDDDLPNYARIPPRRPPGPNLSAQQLRQLAEEKEREQEFDRMLEREEQMDEQRAREAEAALTRKFAPPAVVIAAVVPRAPAPVSVKQAALLSNSANHGPVARPAAPADPVDALGDNTRMGKRRQDVNDDSDEEPTRATKKKVPVKRVESGKGKEKELPASPVAKKASGPKLKPDALIKKASVEAEKNQKKAFVAANVLKTDRKLTISELTLHFGGTAYSTEQSLDTAGQRRLARYTKNGGGESHWAKIGQGLKTRMEDMDCGIILGEEEKGDVRSEGTLRWTRICDKRWNAQDGAFVPLPPGDEILAEEDTRMIFMTASELVDLVESGELLLHMFTVVEALTSNPNTSFLLNPILMIFGLEDCLRQLALDNEAFLTKDQVALELERVQVVMKCCVLCVEDVGEAVDWLEQLSLDVSVKYYQQLKQSHSHTLGGSGDAIKSGTGEQDTYLKLLASISGVTDSLAKGIGRMYPTLRLLYEAYEMENEADRPKLLVGANKMNNVNGAASNASIGKIISARVYQALFEKDGKAPAAG